MGLITWFKKLFAPNISEEYSFDKDIEILKKKEEELTRFTKPINQNTDWFMISIPNTTTNRHTQFFSPKPLSKIKTLKDLKTERVLDEKKRIQNLRNNAYSLADKIKNAIKAENLPNAESLYSALNNIQKQFNDGEIRQLIIELNKDISTLRDIIRKREEEKLKAERDCKERERQAQIEKEKRERLAAELRRREEEAERERQMSTYDKLVRDITRQKDDSYDIANILQNNQVLYFYHFTARENLGSIKANRGLYSWKYCDDNNIIIPKQGGDVQSRGLDKRHGLEDYVRLSFCDDHPMAYHCYNRLSSDLVLLKIKIDVALFKDTLFSDINAADADHETGGTAGFLKENIDFNAVKRNYVKRTDPAFGPHQAEILVKTHVPIDYIININCPTSMSF